MIPSRQDAFGYQAFARQARRVAKRAAMQWLPTAGGMQSQLVRC